MEVQYTVAMDVALDTGRKKQEQSNAEDTEKEELKQRVAALQSALISLDQQTLSRQEQTISQWSDQAMRFSALLSCFTPLAFG